MAAKKPSRHNQEKILFILMGFIILGLIVSGYFLFVRKILPEISSGKETTTAQAAPEGASAAINDDLAAANELIPQEEAQDLRIYFGVKGKDLLTSELRRVRKKTMLIAQARQIIETLLEGPVTGTMYQLLPREIKLRGLYFDSGTFIVDLSREFADLRVFGPTEQILAVYSLVNSLTELDPKARVKFLVNGSEPAAEDGHVDLSLPLTRIEKLIQN
ncbi:MAG TPA: GerMN domain-containing protein [Candidatus Rifleibacterium sp.]|nr:GerMN domain-containing protein [Candidatus Rifleibacterium sp.]HPT45539.1 GerMN domain-containing protein [Candidatus Rifleibacterium sp.]